jgi:PKD repeat protein
MADPDVPISFHQWSGPGGQTSNRPRFTVNTANLKPASYPVTLVVRDGRQRESRGSAILIVQARAQDSVKTTNQPPVARITPGGIEVQQGQPAQFDGSRSTDPDGVIRSWTWSLDGRQASSGRRAQLDTVNLKPGAHTVSLEVVDDRGARDFAEAILTVRPRPAPVQPPVARISPDSSRVNQGTRVTFFSRSYHPERNRRIIGSSWQTSWGQRASGDYIDIDTRELKPGQYSIDLSVVDDTRASNSTQAVLIIEAAKAPMLPVAAITPNHRRVNQGVRVDFSDASYHPNRDTKIVSRRWSTQWGQTHGGNTLTIDTASLPPGSYWISLEVVDQYQTRDSARAVLEIVQAAPLRQPPTARIAPGRIEVPQGQPAHFDGSRSTDPDGVIRSWTWSLDDRPIDRQPSTRIDTSALNPGQYTVRLEITDEHGLTGRDEALLFIVEPPQNFDAAIVELDVSPAPVAPNHEVQIRAVVANLGKNALRNVAVTFEAGGTQIAERMLESLATGETRQITAGWIPRSTGEQIIIATVNPANQPPEVDRANNLRRLPFLVLAEADRGKEGAFTVALRSDLESLRAGDSVTFVSHLDPAADDVEYLFQFGDGEQSEWTRETTASHTYRAGGAYGVTVTARVGGAEIAQSPPMRIVVGSAAGWSWLWLGGATAALAAALEFFKRVRRLRNKNRFTLVPQLNLQELRVATAGQRGASCEIGLRTARGQSRVQVEASGPIVGQRSD